MKIEGKKYQEKVIVPKVWEQIEVNGLLTTVLVSEEVSKYIRHLENLILPKVSRQFKEKDNLKFEEFMNNFCKNGITLTNNYTGETIGFKELVKKYKMTNNIKP